MNKTVSSNEFRIYFGIAGNIYFLMHLHKINTSQVVWDKLVHLVSKHSVRFYKFT